MKLPILDLLKTRTVLFDGGFGTQLIKRGLTDGESPDAWNLDRPGDVMAIHKAYYDAGSDVCITNTFGGNPIKLKAYGREKEVKKINQAAAEIVKKVCPPDRYIAGDIGPTGKFLKPVGDFTVEEYYEAFLEQAEALRDAGVDFIIIETMYDIEEAKAALSAALTTGLPVFITMTFEKKKKGFFTIMGNKPSDSMKALEEAGASLVGANCSLDCREIIDLAREIRQATTLPVLIQPNAGQPILEGGHTTYNQEPKDFAEAIAEIIKLGVNAVGGCCGSDPDFIREMAGVIGIRR